MFYRFGSALIRDLFSGRFRTPNDLDFITNDYDEYIYQKTNHKINASEQRIEYHYIPFAPDREMTLSELYSIKCSHALRDIHWKKTMSDIRYFQLNNIELDVDFYEKLKVYWNDIHGLQRRTNFEGMTVDTFFLANVKREIPHDLIHELVLPEGSIPAYKKIVTDVEPDKNNFFNLEIQDKFNILMEEAYVIAIERYISKFPLYNSYFLAQRDLITRLHPEWLSEFAIQHWNEIFKIQYNYYENYKRNYQHINC